MNLELTQAEVEALGVPFPGPAPLTRSCRNCRHSRADIGRIPHGFFCRQKMGAAPNGVILTGPQMSGGPRVHQEADAACERIAARCPLYQEEV